MQRSQRFALATLLGLGIVLSCVLVFSGKGSGPGDLDDSGLGRDQRGTEEAGPLDLDRDEMVGGAAIDSGDRRVSSTTMDPVTLVVQVTLPVGSPPDETLEVFAMGTDGVELARAAVDGRGQARLEVEDLTFVANVNLDGRFLFLEEAHVPQATDRVRLNPRLGAWVHGHVAPRTGLPDESVEGSLHLAGAIMGGRRGFQFERLSAEIDGGAFEFRGVDPDFDWTLSSELADRHASPIFGVSPDAGETHVVDVEYGLGVRLAGHVLDADGTPVEGATVRTSTDLPWPGAERPETRTDAEGRFALSSVRAGNNTIDVVKQGFVTLTGHPIDLPEGTHEQDLELILSRGMGFDGRVVFPDERPAPNARVRVFGNRPNQGFGNWGGGGGGRRQIAMGVTDESGRFRITGLDQGSFTLDASVHAPALDDTTDPPTQTLWYGTLESATSGTPATIVLRAPVPFAGQVVDDLGEPIQQFEITARSVGLRQNEHSTMFESDDGTYRFDLVPEGEWEVTAIATGHADSEAAALTLPTQERLDFVLPRRMSIHGVVVDPNGAPVPGATVRIEDPSRPTNPWGGGGETSGCNDKGEFTLNDRKPGPIALVPLADAWADGPKVELDVAPGVVLDEVVLSLRVGGRIEGFVFDEAGDPMVGRRVTWSANAMGMGSTNETTTNGAGGFTFERVTPGTWSVTASPSMSEMMSGMSGGQPDAAAWTGMMAQMLTTTVDVADGETSEIWLGGTPKIPVQISGRVTWGGEPVANVDVTAITEGTALIVGMRAGKTNADGRYTLTVDRPGAYVITARRGGTSGEVYVDVPLRDAFTVDVIIPNGRIEGTLRLPGGGVGANLSLALQRDDGNGRVAWTNTQARSGEDGRYVFEDLPEGRYTVRANVSGWGSPQEPSVGSALRSGIQVREDQVTGGVDFQLESAGTVEGRVVDGEGKPVSGATVFFRDGDGRMVSQVGQAISGAGGVFERPGLNPGRYSLSVRSGSGAANDVAQVEVASGATRNVTLTIETGTILVITVEDPNGALQRARLEVLDGEDREVGGMLTMAAITAMFNEGFSTTEQRVGPVPPDRYTVRATLDDGSVVEKKVRVRGRDAEQTVKLRVD